MHDFGHFYAPSHAPFFNVSSTSPNTKKTVRAPEKEDSRTSPRTALRTSPRTGFHGLLGQT